MRWLAIALVVVSSTGSANAGSAAACRSASFSLAQSTLVSEKTGQHTATFSLRNTGAARCGIEGYPTVVLLDAEGRTLAFRYHRGGDQMITTHPPRPLTVAAHSRVYFALNKYRCDIRATAVARFVRVTLPGSRGQLTVRLEHDPILDFCHEAASRTVGVSPLVAKLSSAFLGR